MLVRDSDGFDAMHAYAYASEMYKNIWVSQECLPNVLEYHQGSAAGTPLADLVVSVAMSRVLHVLRSSLKSDGLSKVVQFNGLEFSPRDVSFVDDSAIPVIDSASSIQDSVCGIVHVAVSVFSMYGMVLNFQPGKSEGTIKHRGAGKVNAENSLAQNNCCLHIPGNAEPCRIVRSYKHLGTKASADNCIYEEIALRAGIMKTESARLEKHVLRSCAMSVPRKVRVMKAYVLSKGTHHCGTWPSLNVSQYNRFHYSIVSIYRDISGHY